MGTTHLEIREVQNPCVPEIEVSHRTGTITISRSEAVRLRDELDDLIKWRGWA